MAGTHVIRYTKSGKAVAPRNTASQIDFLLSYHPEAAKKGWRNRAFDRENTLAAYQQTPEEHASFFNAYRNKKGTIAPTKMALARMDAKHTIKYWNDSTPRAPLDAGSSVIRNITYNFNPRGDNGAPRRCNVVIGGRPYWYMLTPKEVGRWVSSGSIGKWYNSHIKLK